LRFNPVVIKDLFSQEDVLKLKTLVSSKGHEKIWTDRSNSRGVRKYSELDTYFSKKLEPIAREIFGDPTLKTTYSVYLDYDRPTSSLDMHMDNNACTYTIDYCLSAITPWGLVVGEKEEMFLPGEGLAFMGGNDAHGRNPMPNPEKNRVEAIMFHFCPKDHWYFTEGPEYVYTLSDAGILPEGDSYHLSPKVIKNSVQ
jgi:hypothetical protein